MKGLFITSSGTGIGKTFVTTILAGQCRRKGRRVTALKPVISGFDRQTAATSDTALILEALGREVSAENIEAVSPWRFAAPLSPDMAARRQGRDIDFRALTDYCESEMKKAPDVLLIEGVGGVMAPLCRDATVLDLMAALGLPALLVVGSYLGAISHTLTAALALKARGIEIAGVILSESESVSDTGPAPPPPSLEETADSLRRFLGAVPIVTLPRQAHTGSPWLAAPDLAGALEF